MWDQPFALRLAVLVAVLVTAAAIELALAGRRAHRYREYAFLLSMAAAGGALGAGIDQITATLSPEYFTLGKSIAPGPGFRRRVAALGFEAGFVAAIVIAGSWLWARSRWSSRVGYRRLGAMSVTPIWHAAAGGIGLALLWAVAGSGSPEASGAQARMGIVFGAHLGLYLGATLGAGRVVLRIRRLRDGFGEEARTGAG